MSVAEAQNATEALPTATDVTVTDDPVSASSLPALWHVLKERASVDDRGRHAIVSTAIMFAPRVRYIEAPDSCVVASAEVRVVARVTLPMWRERRFVREEERHAWDLFRDRLQRHEKEHVAIAEAFAEQLADAVAGMPSAPDCKALDRTVGEVRDAILSRHRRAQLALDARDRSDE